LHNVKVSLRDLALRLAGGRTDVIGPLAAAFGDALPKADLNDPVLPPPSPRALRRWPSRVVRAVLRW
jgi:hypothetical protein